MKTILPFLILQVASFFGISFIFEGIMSAGEIMIFSTLIAYVVYRLLKEDHKL